MTGSWAAAAMLAPAEAAAAVRSKDWHRTLAHCRAGLTHDGSSYALACLEALCCLHLRRHEEAAAAGRAAAALQPEATHAWKGLLQLRVIAGAEHVDDSVAHEALRRLRTLHDASVPKLCRCVAEQCAEAGRHAEAAVAPENCDNVL